MPEAICRNFLVPAIQSFRHHRIVSVIDPVYKYFSIFFELPHDVADILDLFAGCEQRTFIDFCFHPLRGGLCLLWVQV